MTAARSIENVTEKVLRRLVPDGECLIWPGAAQHGHGFVTVNGRHRYVNRIVYEHRHGPLPDSTHLKATCGNPRCVSRDHLHVFGGTNP